MPIPGRTSSVSISILTRKNPNGSFQNHSIISLSTSTSDGSRIVSPSLSEECGQRQNTLVSEQSSLMSSGVSISTGLEGMDSSLMDGHIQISSRRSLLSSLAVPCHLRSSSIHSEEYSLVSLPRSHQEICSIHFSVRAVRRPMNELSNSRRCIRRSQHLSLR